MQVDKVPANEIDRAVSNHRAAKELNTYSLAEMKSKYIGKVGTQDRDEYEYELRMDVLGKITKAARQERNLAQKELGRPVGVKKTQISKLGSSAKKGR